VTSSSIRRTASVGRWGRNPDVAGQSVSLYAITFEKERMKLKIPVGKAKTSGLRRLSSRIG